MSDPSYYPTPPQAIQTSSAAIISLICSILAWLGLFGLGGILAVIFGHVAKNEIKKSNGLIGGDGMATVGLVLGYANVAISLLGLCFAALIFLGLLSTPLCLIPFVNDINLSFTTIPN